VTYEPNQRYASGRLAPRRRTFVRRRRRAGAIGAIGALGDIACGDRSTPATEDAVFSSSTEMWRPLVSAQSGGIPVNFLLAWIQIESCGNPCSWTSSSEAGIFQLMPPDNIAQGGTSVAAIHPVPPCVSGAQNTAYYTSLSSDQQYEQVRSGIQFVNYCRTQAHQALSNAGQDWGEDAPDFWMMVKLWHALPGIIAPGLASAASTLGYPPNNWSDFLQGSAAQYSTPIANAQWTGSFGIGGASAIGLLSWIGLGIVAWLALRPQPATKRA